MAVGENDPTGSQPFPGSAPESPRGPLAPSQRQLERTSDLLPERIGSYRVLAQLGIGGMGVVYEAEQANPRRRVALKTIRSDLVSDERLRRFAAESVALARLQHSAIAQIYEAGSADSTPFFAMELVKGRTLARYVNEEKLSIRARLALVVKIADAVHYAHKQSVIHLDLKPANVVVDVEGNPKILDFGVAKILGGDPVDRIDREPHFGFVGTLRYMSPEQTRGVLDHLDARSDVYTLGVIAYELLTGRLPYELAGLPRDAAFEMIQQEPPADLIDLPILLRSDVEIVVKKALDKDRERRYRSAHEFSEDLSRVLTGARPAAARPTILSKLHRWGVHESRIEQAGIAGLVIAVILGVFNGTYAVLGVVMMLGLAPGLASGIRVTEFTTHNAGWAILAIVMWRISRQVRQKHIPSTWFAVFTYAALCVFTISVLIGVAEYDMGGALADISVRSVLYALLTPTIFVVWSLNVLALIASYAARQWERPPTGGAIR